MVPAIKQEGIGKELHNVTPALNLPYLFLQWQKQCHTKIQQAKVSEAKFSESTVATCTLLNCIHHCLDT